jgi:hypothetical protein
VCLLAISAPPTEVHVVIFVITHLLRQIHPVIFDTHLVIFVITHFVRQIHQVIFAIQHLDHEDHLLINVITRRNSQFRCSIGKIGVDFPQPLAAIRRGT